MYEGFGFVVSWDVRCDIHIYIYIFALAPLHNFCFSCGGSAGSFFVPKSIDVVLGAQVRGTVVYMDRSIHETV